MASAILSVLYSEDFSVYDARVCGQLRAFKNLADRKRFENLWAGYQEFLEAVRKATPADLSLRDKDRWLWGKSFCDQLRSDIQSGFNKC